LDANVTPTAARAALKEHLVQNPTASVDPENAATSNESTATANLTKQQKLM
jgi:hypothetical protein